MRFLPTAAALLLVTPGLSPQDYLTKDGKLAHQLKIVQLQGGFAGFTGVEWTVAPDGKWTKSTVFNKKTTPKAKGKLSPKQIGELADILQKNKLAELPDKSGRPPGANPHTLKFEFGKKKVSLSGRVPPKVDPDNPTGSVGSRFAGIWKGVAGMLKVAPKSKRTLKEFQSKLNKTFTPAKTIATFGPPNQKGGSGLIIYTYDLDDDTKLRLGFPGQAPIQYAHHVLKGGSFEEIPLE